ncbi:hypothetical protein CHUAL_007145 [Chamberlinius hualienensis]
MIFLLIPACVVSGIILVFGICWLYRRQRIPNFASKLVFISGCDSGFGEALAIKLDKLGVGVYAGCYTKDGATRLKAKTSQQLKTFLLDISDQSSVDRLKEDIEKDLSNSKELWGIVNNAGISGIINLPLSSVADYQNVLEVNFLGHVRIIQAFSPLIKKSRGRIVNVSSVLGRVASKGAPYECSKFALEAYSDGLRRYMATLGVHVATLEPGAFAMNDILNKHMFESLEKKWAELSEIERQEFEEDYLDKNLKFMRKALNRYPCTYLNKKSMVVNAMVHALLAKHPKARYACGYDARLIIGIGIVTPDWIMDFVLKVSGLSYK